MYDIINFKTAFLILSHIINLKYCLKIKLNINITLQTTNRTFKLRRNLLDCKESNLLLVEDQLLVSFVVQLLKLLLLQLQ